MSDSDPFARLGQPRRIWAVAACHGDTDRLDRLHTAIAERFAPGDRLIYLGNYVGGGEPAAAIDRLLAFRRELLARPGMLADDIVYLRGVQEEIWHKLLQIQIAPNPKEVLAWMLDHGGAATAEAYGGITKDGLSATREGATAMARWTGKLRNAIREKPGHEKFWTVLQRAAFTESPAGGLLFVHSGLDPARPLAAQGDSFWWGSAEFDRIGAPFETFVRVFRGYDPAGKGVEIDGYAVTLDGMCRAGGPLVGAEISADGRISELFEA